MITYHPQLNDKGQPVRLAKPSTPTPLASWSLRDAVMTVVPGGVVPDELNGIALAEWKDTPSTEQAWNDVEGQLECDEPHSHFWAGIHRLHPAHEPTSLFGR